LGASAGRLVRQILTESTLLTLAGGLLGLAAAALGSRALVHLLPDLAPRWREVGVDLPVALATLGLALASGLVSGLAPAFRLARTDLRASLHEGSGGASLGWRRNRAVGLLAVAQLALSFVLLVGAGLLVRSFWLLTHVDPGFAPEGVLTLRVELPRSQYPEGRQRAAFFAAALERLRALPGVASAGAASTLPLSGAWNLTEVKVPGRPASDQDFTIFSAVTPGYLETLKMRLAAGRTLSDRDRSAIVVSRSLAHRYFPGEDPLGKTLRLGSSPDAPQSRIVGVVEDVRARGLESAGGPAVYGLVEPPAMTFCLRTRLDPLQLAPAARRAILAVDPRQPVDAIAPLDQVLRDSVADHQLALFALSGFAALALVLATVGIYGVLSHGVARATREIGVRLALGAERRHLVGLVSAYTAQVLAPGLALGAGLAFAASRLLASQLFGISRADAPTYVGAAVLLTVLAVAACFAPARRAARVDPRAALAEE
jgi:predicted permease